MLAELVDIVVIVSIISVFVFLIGSNFIKCSRSLWCFVLSVLVLKLPSMVSSVVVVVIVVVRELGGRLRHVWTTKNTTKPHSHTNIQTREKSTAADFTVRISGCWSNVCMYYIQLQFALHVYRAELSRKCQPAKTETTI